MNSLVQSNVLGGNLFQYIAEINKIPMQVIWPIIERIVEKGYTKYIVFFSSLSYFFPNKYIAYATSIFYIYFSS